MAKNSLRLLLSGLVINNINALDTKTYGTHEYGEPLPNSCIGLEDGDYWLQLSAAEESYNPVKLTCSNEYIIIDLVKDHDLQDYFTSFELWHYQLAGPANHNPVTWQEWFIPTNQESDEYVSSYLISPDCNTCDIDETYQVHNDDTTYWMTGNLAKLHWPVIGFNECDMDWDTYDCYNCQSCMKISNGCSPVKYNDNATDFSSAGICGVTKQISSHEVYYTREYAQSQSHVKNYKPSIGTDSKFCQCYKPDIKLKTKYYLTNEQESLLEQKEASYVVDHLAQEEEEGDEETEVETEKNTQNTKNVENVSSRKDSNNDNNDESETEVTEVTGRSFKEQYSSSKVGNNNDDDDSSSSTSATDNIVFLDQSYFLEGTFNIQESGTYILTEDITFDFNNADNWWPREDQSTKYPGADGYRDSYHLGFFAGITVECNDVIIDLNGHTLQQSVEFYFQQRWFALIELGNQQFLPGQGPAFFGPDPVLVDNIEIKNGVLGRTSHFAIHGNFPTNINFHDLKINGFVTHGIQLNGWENLIMNNIEVGPSSTIEYLKGDYGHARILEQRLERIEDTLVGYSQEEINEYNAYQHGDYYENLDKLAQIREELKLQMNFAYEYAINRVNNKYADTDYINPKHLKSEDDLQRWSDTKEQFIHTSGYPSASSITGIFLNFEGASVFSYTMYTTHQSSNGKLSNIYIHDISHDMVESMRFGFSGASGQMYPTPWNSDIPADHAVGGKANLLEFFNLITAYSANITSKTDTLNEIKNNPMYHYGTSIMADVYFTMATVSDDWDELGFLEIKALTNNRTEVYDWVNGIYSEDILDWRFGCNQDIMGHSGKGLLGIRIDGVDTLELSNIKISNLKEYSELGSLACGEYKSFTPENNGGHFKQSQPMQHGFSGNDLQAMSIISSTNLIFKEKIEIDNLFNDYSQSTGISFWTANNVLFDKGSFVKVKNIDSGIKLLDYENNNNIPTLTYLSTPNRAPESCAVRMEDSEEASYYKSFIRFEGMDNGTSNILTCNINARYHCLGYEYSDHKDSHYTMYGNYFAEEDICNAINSKEDLDSYLAAYLEANQDKSNDALPRYIKSDNKVNDDVAIVGVDNHAVEEDNNNGNNKVIDEEGNVIEDEILDETATNGIEKGTSKSYHISGIIIFIIIAVSISTMVITHCIRQKCCERFSSSNFEPSYTLIRNHQNRNNNDNSNNNSENIINDNSQSSIIENNQQFVGYGTV